ncbi:MAG: protease complex subunit PrcB family protein [Gammaproteobacteria bacterium]|nr:protease complex subunit PrcB family protein [Gammaproteobacteria bacterium]
MRSNISVQRFEVVYNNSELDNLWMEQGQGLGGEHGKPVVDFEIGQALALFLGQRSTGGCLIDIENIIELESQVDIHILETVPGAGCAVTTAFTQPYLFVEIIKTNKLVSFQIRSETVNCN